jgi:hypothetical protein
MNDLENISFDKLLRIYQKYFSLHYINTNTDNKLALIALICFLTNELRKKDKNITCYDVLLKIGKDFPDLQKNTFLKSLACVCQDIMYGCKEFNTFGVERKDVPATIKKLLNEYVPF